MRKIVWIVILSSIFLASCQGGQSEAVQTVENYYQAMVERDDARFAGFACAAWEEQALLEYDSFAGVKIVLDGFACQETGSDGDARLVTCQGKIAATYGSEQMDFLLDDRLHRVVNEGGEWRVCGY